MENLKNKISDMILDFSDNTADLPRGDKQGIAETLSSDIITLTTKKQNDGDDLADKDQLLLSLSDMRSSLVMYWIHYKNKPYFNPTPYQIIDRNITSIEKQIKKL